MLKQFICGQAGSGKAQPLTAKVVTPVGMKNIGNIKTGDFVIDIYGKACLVLAIFPQGIKDIYEVTFSDGSKTRCCKEHLWVTKSYKERLNYKNYTIRSLGLMQDSIYTRKNNSHKNYSIPIVKNPVEFFSRPIIIDPYFLGVLLGDGSFRGGKSIKLSTADREIITNVTPLIPNGYEIRKIVQNKYDYRIVRNSRKSEQVLENAIEGLKLNNTLSEHKHIPKTYLYNSKEIRIKLLQGLMDTDGTVSLPSGMPVFNTSSLRLATDVKFLVESLGGVVKTKTKIPKYKYRNRSYTGLLHYILHICLPNSIVPFTIHRQTVMLKQRTKYKPIRYITNIELVGTEECVCIKVNSDEGLYLTDDFIVTHNTTYIQKEAEKNPNLMELTSTTGISAINLGTRTLNSRLKYFNTKSLIKIYESGLLQLRMNQIRERKRILVVEECSILPAERLDLIVETAELADLGIILVGDLLQLPNIEDSIIIEAKSWPEFEQNQLKLTKIWRQDNPLFIKALNLIRSGNGKDGVPLLKESGVTFLDKLDETFLGTTITALNKSVDQFNIKRLNQINSDLIRVMPIRRGTQLTSWECYIPYELRLKVGSYIMILTNDTETWRYINGDCGNIVSYDKKTDLFKIKLKRNNQVVEIGKIKRLNLIIDQPDQSFFSSMFQPFVDFQSNEWCIGSIEYHPLRLAYCSTVHKVQGLTLDKVQLDIRYNFFKHPSMCYVGLSRIRKPENLFIVGSERDLVNKICIDDRVRRFV